MLLLLHIKTVIDNDDVGRFSLNYVDCFIVTYIGELLDIEFTFQQRRIAHILLEYRDFTVP